MKVSIRYESVHHLEEYRVYVNGAEYSRITVHMKSDEKTIS
jgi:hypothetical protein